MNVLVLSDEDGKIIYEPKHTLQSPTHIHPVKNLSRLRLSTASSTNFIPSRCQSCSLPRFDSCLITAAGSETVANPQNYYERPARVLHWLQARDIAVFLLSRPSIVSFCIADFSHKNDMA
ncbi:hypothetical protein J3459_016726 [Metarhizium acridum]|nr:hypothetical protein J3459_016726 [Metarhizium acridum]